MKKIILIILLWFIYTMPIDSVMAHTYLQESEPNQGEVVTKPISDLLLIFETRIENGSTLELVNHSKGSTIIPEKITIETSQMRARVPALATGEYTVKWKVIGADGHIIQGEYSFMIDVPNNPDEQKSNRDGTDIENQENQEAPEKQNESPENSPTQEQGEAAATDKNAVSNDDSKSKPATGDNKTDELSPISILLGILGILVGIGLLFRFLKGR